MKVLKYVTQYATYYLACLHIKQLSEALYGWVNIG